MGRIRRAAQASAAQFAESVWPRRSLVSGEPALDALSASDFAALTFLTGPQCQSCALPQSLDLGADTVCAACIAKPPPWSRARAALAYDDVSRTPILALKHSGARDGLAVMGRWIAFSARDLLDEADLLVPVPLHYSRLIARGFNQSAWLCQAVKTSSGTPVCVDALKRRRATPSQSGLSASARRRNVAGAFMVRSSRKSRIRQRRILLIDDVYTTGSTLSACTSALLRAGASSVDVAVLARVVKPTDPTI